MSTEQNIFADDFDDVSRWILDMVELDEDRQVFEKSAADVPASSAEFLDRAREATAAAATLLKCRGWAQSEGFLPLSFAAYLRRLEGLAEVSLEALKRHFGISRVEPIDESSVNGIGSLWEALGFSWEEARANLRISLLGADALALGRSVRMRSTSGSSAIEGFDRKLREVESNQTEAYREQLHRLETLLRKGYRSNSE